jgi:hypothetical protein
MRAGVVLVSIECCGTWTLGYILDGNPLRSLISALEAGAGKLSRQLIGGRYSP